MGHAYERNYCEKQGIRHVPFVDFNKVLEKVQEVVGGKSVDEVLKEEGQ
ncbi:Conserved hypothetical protein [Cryptococcus gattii WM276]|uniref:Uncharacterized protein n=1 Tax=Cryptococcus gattii serotype B (strain WM276 / ATCC MYA-4071) TaxID=367775 RepID=E6R2H9_CRYGW|nr:uncharacterized protein CGB_C9710C [Cryptococcus gattii WM276]ADV21387.1 Conserved hypothetical protein [Cryptococcus gattii WM276]